MLLIVSIVLGLIAGATVRWLMPGPDPLGRFGAVILGAAGAVAGYAAAAALGLTSPDDSPVPVLGMALSGAMGVLILYRSYAMRVAE